MKAKLEKILKLGIIKTYKSLFHTLGILIFVFEIKLLGFNELLTFEKEVLPIQLILLAVNFFMIEYALEKFGINKLMEDELKNIQK